MNYQGCFGGRVFVPDDRENPPENPNYEKAVHLGDLVDELTTLVNAADDIKRAFEYWTKYPSICPECLTIAEVSIDRKWAQQIFSHLAAALDAAEAELREFWRKDNGPPRP